MIGVDMTGDEPIRTDRRKLLKAGLATTGAAYAVPQILNTTAAGAQTTVCYGVKLEESSPGSGSTSCTGLDFGTATPDPSCGTNFNTALSGVLGVSPGASSPHCAWMTNVTFVGANTAFSWTETTDQTITIPDNCEFAFVGFKAGQGCYWIIPPGTSVSSEGTVDPGVFINLSNGNKTATIGTTSSGGTAKDISHLTLAICCTGSP